MKTRLYEISAHVILLLGTCSLLCPITGCKDEETVYADAATLELDPLRPVEFAPEGGTAQVKVRTNMPRWEVDYEADWFTVDPTPEGFTITARANRSVSTRAAAALTVTAGDRTNHTDETITVSQTGLEPATLTIYPEGSLAFGYAGGTQQIEVHTNQSTWNASTEADWIQIDTADNYFTVAVRPNDFGSARANAEIVVTAGPEYNRARDTIVVTQSEKPTIAGIDLSCEGTANCYMVSGAGSYLFNATMMGNNAQTVGITPGSITPVSAELLWQDYYENGEGLIRAVNLEGAYVHFETYETYHKGNAVIAVRNAAGQIAWSWHLWFTDDIRMLDLENAVEGAGVCYTVMDRNTGAVSAEPGNGRSLGLLYQWGRKDPFVGGAGKGASERTRENDPFMGSNATDRAATAFTYDIQGNVNNCAENMVWRVAKESATVEDAVRNPTTFYPYDPATKPATYDWLAVPDPNLWGNPWESSTTYPLYTDRAVNSGAGVKSIYDPCPPGYRVIPMDTWAKAGATKVGRRVTFDEADYGFWFNILADGGGMWFPLAGYRSHLDGGLESVGSAGFLWSNSPYGPPDDPYGAYSSCLSSSSMVFAIIAMGDRSRGYPVRCCKE